MATNKARRYRCTVWPEAPLPRPRAFLLPLEVEDSGELSHGRGGRFIELPDELVLRELQNLPWIESPGAGDAYIDFLTSWGSIWSPFTIVEGWIGARPLVPPTPAENSVQLQDAANWLQYARTLAAHWIAHKEGASVSKVWKRDLTPDADGIIDDDWAWQIWTISLNGALRKFAPRVRTQNSAMNDDEWLGEFPPDLYEALCAQLFNIVVEDLPVRTCANEACRCTFVKQRGTAHAGQYRTKGVLYCSRSCAWAQSARDRRRSTRNQANTTQKKKGNER